MKIIRNIEGKDEIALSFLDVEALSKRINWANADENGGIEIEVTDLLENSQDEIVNWPVEIE